MTIFQMANNLNNYSFIVWKIVPSKTIEHTSSFHKYKSADLMHADQKAHNKRFSTIISECVELSKR